MYVCVCVCVCVGGGGGGGGGAYGVGIFWRTHSGFTGRPIVGLVGQCDHLHEWRQRAGQDAPKITDIFEVNVHVIVKGNSS